MHAVMNFKNGIALFFAIASGAILILLLWWQRSLSPMFFFILIAAAVLGSSVTWFILLLKQSRKNATKPVAAKAKSGMFWPLDTLFIFNTLHNISALTLLDAEKSRDTIENLAELIRMVNEIGKQEKTLLAQEVRCAELYMIIEQARLGKRLKISKKIAPECREDLLPSLILLPLMEHAIVHMVEPSEKQVIISLRAYRRQKSLVIEVIDIGDGVVEEKIIIENKEDKALAKARAILQQHYGDRYRLETITVKPSGYLIRLQLPQTTHA